MMFHATRHAEFCGQCNKYLSPGGDDKVFIGGFCQSCFDMLTNDQIRDVVEQAYMEDMRNCLGNYHEQLEAITRAYMMDIRNLRNGRESA